MALATKEYYSKGKADFSVTEIISPAPYPEASQEALR
jgi:hypothetical protein